MTSGVDFLVNRSDFSTTQIAPITAPSAEELKAGQVLLKVDRFAFTANNITYATLGNALNYWNFFPKAEGWGNIPVWGFADVIASNCEDTNEGERFYGYYPMSTHLIVEPTKVTANSFVDGAKHRQALSVIYNQYIRCANDSLYTADTEALQMLLRPLFTTSFLLDDFFDDNAFFGANNLILTSASSKTAIGMAFLLSRSREKRAQQYKVIGLTSSNNAEFVKGLGCYDQVLTYDEVNELDCESTGAIIDFAGNGELLGQVHSLLNEQLKYSCLVGVSHWDQRGGLPKDLAGPAPQMFFAPAQAQQRLEDWGSTEFQQRMTEVWLSFTAFVSRWIQIEDINGADSVTHAYKQVLEGKSRPAMAYTLSMSE